MGYFLQMPIVVKADVGEGVSVGQVVDEDVRQFNEYFQSLGNDPLIGFEKAALKTYLLYKLRGESNAEKAAG